MNITSDLKRYIKSVNNNDYENSHIINDDDNNNDNRYDNGNNNGKDNGNDNNVF